MKKDKRITEYNQKLIDLQIDQLQAKNIKIKELKMENFQLKKDLQFETRKHRKSEIIKDEFFQKINNVLGVSPVFTFDQIVDLVEEHLELIVTNAGQIDDLESTIKLMETDFDEEERENTILNNERTELIKENLLKESNFQEYKKIWKKQKDELDRFIEKDSELFELCMELYNSNINQNIFEKRLIETEEYKDAMDRFNMEQNKLYP